MYRLSIFVSRWTYFAIYVSKLFPYIHQSLTNDSSQSFLFVKILGLYYVFHHEIQCFSFVIDRFDRVMISLNIILVFTLNPHGLKCLMKITSILTFRSL